MYTAEKNACVPVEMPRETLTEKLSRERDRLMTRDEEIDAVLAMFKSNPQIQGVLDVLQKCRAW